MRNSRSTSHPLTPTLTPAMNNSPEGAQGSANSKTPLTDETTKAIRFIAKRWLEGNLTEYQFADRIESLMDGPRKMERQLAQSQERVKALTEGLDKLTAWGMYCPDWADPKSKDEYAKDFMAALALLQNKLR